MLVYRIEDKRKLGPYRSLNTMEKFGIARHGFDEYHKPPNKDTFNKDYLLTERLCGFKSKKQLLKWFTNRQLKIMFKAGYKLKIKYISEKYVAISKIQVLVNKRIWHNTKKEVKIHNIKDI